MGTSVKLAGYAQCIAYRALSRINTNTPVMSMGWQGPKGENRNDLEDVRGKDKPKKQNKMYKRTGVKEAIKACDLIVERRRR